jgi:thioesterase domain-containing protein
MPAARSSSTWNSAVLTAELQSYLYQHIPLSRAMQVSVLQVDAGEVRLQAPLEPNINHQRTVFGGSAAALAMLASWSLLQIRLQEADTPAQLVIQRHTMDFALPVRGEFSARATLLAQQRWEPFLAALARRGRARVAVVALIEQTQTVAARFTGEFVALAADSPV